MSAADALAGILPTEALSPETSIQPALGRPPETVVRPSSPEEVAALMAWATREGVGVLPMSSGRRLQPVGREGRYIAVVTDRLSGVERYEAADLTLRAGAGTPFAAIARTLAGHRQWMPVDPPHADERSVGGLVAASDPGPLSTGYGELRHHVLGLTVVTGDGRCLDLGGGVVKNVAGFDLLKAVVGSRGTLAVLTSVTLRAFPLPPVDRLLGLDGASVGALLEPALKVGTAPILPASCVVADAVPAGAGEAILAVRLHGARETVDADQRRLEEHVGARFRILEESAPERDEATGFPGAGDARTRLRDHGADHEIVVTASSRPSRLPAVLEAMEAVDPQAIHVDSYGGFGRGGPPGAHGDSLRILRERVERTGSTLRVFSRRIESMARAGGSRPSEGEERLIRRVREAFDPGEVLWPTRR